MTAQLLKDAKKASRQINSLSDEKISAILRKTADALTENTCRILRANKSDLEKFSQTDYRFDRLRLDNERIEAIANDMRNVAALPSPARTLEERTLPNGLYLQKVAVPFGVVGVIYEARPNVSADVFSLCLKSKNVCVLKGGHEAENTNREIIGIIRETLRDSGVTPDAAVLLPSTREATGELLRARGLVDLIIPRGSKNLIDFVRDNSLVPVIETGAGVCHCYIHSSANSDYAAAIVTNAKTRRVSVCNALDCVLIDEEAVSRLPQIFSGLALDNVIVHADDKAMKALEGHYPGMLLRKASEQNYGTEFLGYEMAVKVVKDFDEAIDHIDRFGSGHSESIVAEDASAIKAFTTAVDAACVYVNAPTSFTDGAQFGLGAEIGISTQKLHARGPMALRELMTYKWIVTGHGQVRP